MMAVETGPKRAAVRRSRRRVLVVEDEPLTADLVARYLEDGGYETAIERDGQAACQLRDDDDRASYRELISVVDRCLAGTIVEAQAREIGQMNARREEWYGSPSPAGGVPEEGAAAHGG